MLTRISELTESQLEAVLAMVKNQRDFTINDWELDLAYRHVFAADHMLHFIGMCAWTGGPHNAQPYFWIRPDERRKGYGTWMVDQLAGAMGAHDPPVVGLGPMPITATGDEYYAAAKLAQRLRARIEGNLSD